LIWLFIKERMVAATGNFCRSSITSSNLYELEGCKVWHYCQFDYPDSSHCRMGWPAVLVNIYQSGTNKSPVQQYCPSGCINGGGYRIIATACSKIFAV